MFSNLLSASGIWVFHCPILTNLWCLILFIFFHEYFYSISFLSIFPICPSSLRFSIYRPSAYKIFLLIWFLFFNFKKCLNLCIIILLLYWGYSMTFSKVLIVYHSWIYPSSSPFSPISPFLEWFQQISFYHLHVCVWNISIIFSLLHPFLIFPLHKLVPTPRQDMFYLPVFEKKSTFVCLR
jgi:hypothetical protein